MYVDYVPRGRILVFPGARFGEALQDCVWWHHTSVPSPGSSCPYPILFATGKSRQIFVPDSCGAAGSTLTDSKTC